jgi:hypothetical protein
MNFMRFQTTRMAHCSFSSRIHDGGLRGGLPSEQKRQRLQSGKLCAASPPLFCTGPTESLTEVAT